jgi:anti-sigma regulatory factor (Ser/Thr protein kinase)
MTPFRREFHLTGTMADLPSIGEFIEEVCAQANIAQAARFDVLMAVDEACSNVFEHAYGCSAGDVYLSFETRGKDVVISVHDHGRAFNPDGVPAPDMSLALEERPIGGLGLHLMRRLMDKVTFAFSPEHGNTLIMEKYQVAPGDNEPRSSGHGLTRSRRGKAARPTHGSD